MSLIEQKIIFVTGANKGIGLAIAVRELDQNNIVYLGCRDIKSIPKSIAECENSYPIALDVQNHEQIKAVFLAIRRGHGKLDVLVNNAGIMLPGMVSVTGAENIERMLATNTKGTFYCAQLAARLMVAKKTGSIINITSIMGVRGAAGYTAYSMSKSAVIGLTKALSKELAAFNIRVNAVAPGFIETGLTADVDQNSREKTLNNIGMGRFGDPDDVANLVSFLANDQSRYVTGQIIGVDGGMVI